MAHKDARKVGYLLAVVAFGWIVATLWTEAIIAIFEPIYNSGAIGRIAVAAIVTTIVVILFLIMQRFEDKDVRECVKSGGEWSDYQCIKRKE